MSNIKFTFEKDQRRELNVFTYEMCVLMLFNNADRLSYKKMNKQLRFQLQI
jgi:cullin 3